MKFKICLALVLLLPLSVMAKKKLTKNKKTPKIELATAADSASYALGVYMGTKSAYAIEQQGLKAEIFARGYNDALFGAETIMSNEFASAYLDEYAKKMVEIENEARKKAQADFLAENKKREGVVETASGLQYQVVKAGEGAYPTPTSKVKVHYEGFLLDGTKFDSSLDRGKPLEFRLDRVIKGWAEGVVLMQPGAKYTLYIPYELGYGAQGAGAVVKPYSTLIFEVELLEVVSE